MTLANDYSCVYSYVYPYEHSNLSYPHSNRGLVPLHSFLLALHICIVSTNPEWPLVQWVWVTFIFCPSSVRIVAMHAQRYVRLHLGTPRSLWAEPHQQFARPCRPCKQYRLLRLLFKASSLVLPPRTSFEVGAVALRSRAREGSSSPTPLFLRRSTINNALGPCPQHRNIN